MRPGILWPLIIIHSMTEKGVETRGAICPKRDTRTEITIAPNEGDFRAGIRIVERLECTCELVLIACGPRSLVADRASTEHE